MEERFREWSSVFRSRKRFSTRENASPLEETLLHSVLAKPWPSDAHCSTRVGLWAISPLGPPEFVPGSVQPAVGRCLATAGHLWDHSPLFGLEAGGPHQVPNHAQTKQNSTQPGASFSCCWQPLAKDPKRTP